MLARTLVLATLLGATPVSVAQAPAPVAVYTEAQAARGKLGSREAAVGGRGGRPQA
ncbi:MAG: hypothetical protein K0R70_2566 [Steroidobacteraceae bacterium]|nr:hypothetical protein [Steroidobacteraceae bacterium]